MYFFHLFFNPSHKQIHYFFLLDRSKFNIFRYSVPLVKATAAAARRCVLCDKHRVSAHWCLAWPSFAINDGASLSRTKSRACERTVSIPLFFTYSLSFSFSLKLLLNFDFSNFKSACSIVCIKSLSFASSVCTGYIGNFLCEFVSQIILTHSPLPVAAEYRRCIHSCLTAEFKIILHLNYRRIAHTCHSGFNEFPNNIILRINVLLTKFKCIFVKLINQPSTVLLSCVPT